MNTSPKQFLYSVIKQRNYLIATGKSKINDSTVLAEFRKAHTWAMFWKDKLSDESAAKFIRANESLMRHIIPGNGTSGKKQHELLNQIINQL
jgi:hypothetical protein